MSFQAAQYAYDSMLPDDGPEYDEDEVEDEVFDPPEPCDDWDPDDGDRAADKWEMETFEWNRPNGRV